MGATQIHTDLLVIGGGLAGMTVAARASQLGASVVVVEASDHVGGSAALSEGFVWTAPDEETFRREDPDGNVEQFLAMRSEFDHTLDWVRDLGVQVGPLLDGILGFGIGHRIDIGRLLQAERAIVENQGGPLFLNTTADGLVKTADRVEGAVMRELRTRESYVVKTDAVVLATGGFQGSAELREQHLFPGARDLLLRSNEHSDGAGLRLGRDAGAALTARMDGFYGHLVPAPLQTWVASEYTFITQYHSDHGLLLDHGGRRFCDESLGDHINAEEVARQGTALLLIDERIRRERVLPAFIPGMAEVDKMAEGGARGGLYATGDTIEEIASVASTAGYDADRIVHTVAGFNRSLERAPDRLVPPRAANRTAIDEPPFALLQVQAAITFTYGGLSADIDGRVLDAATAPIAGLYAAGVDAGGLNARGYTGGLVRGLTLGRRLAEVIVRR